MASFEITGAMDTPLGTLVRSSAHLMSERIPNTSDDEADKFSQKKRITVHALKTELDAKGPAHLFLRKAADVALNVDGVMVQFQDIFVFPKYKVGIAEDVSARLQQALAITLATTPAAFIAGLEKVFCAASAARSLLLPAANAFCCCCCSCC